MSKSLKRVMADTERLGLDISMIETPDGTDTAQMPADFCGCALGQIAKSAIFRTQAWAGDVYHIRFKARRYE